MKPRSLSIREFRGWRESGEIPLDRPITLVVGENGRGKSSLTTAIEWCLFGREIESAGGLGIDERADWEVRPREASQGPTEVSLGLDAPEGPVTVVRRRAAHASGRGGDEVEVRTPSGVLADAAALEWLRRRMPDLETFRRAHALHPESVRRRATDAADRAAILAILLGLEDDREARERWKDAKALDLVRDVDLRLRRLEADVDASADRPRRDREEVEKRLLARGLARGDLSPERAAALRDDLTARARALAQRLGLDPKLPPVGIPDSEAFHAWARAWPLAARERAPALTGLQARRNGLSHLDAGLAELAPLEDGLRRARETYEQAVHTGGDRPARERAIVEATAKATQAAADLQRASSLVSLLEDALALAPDVDERTPCPVCATPVLGLRARIGEALAHHRDDDVSRLVEAKAKAQAARQAAERALDDLARAERSGHAAREARDQVQKRLAALLPPDAGSPGVGSPVDGPTHDLAAAARVRAEVLRREIEGLEGLAKERDAALARHAADHDLLRDLEAWVSAVARLDREVEVTRCPSFDRLDAAVDAVAGFAADVESLSSMARDAQAERSVARGAAVNRTLGEYYDAIVGAGGRGLQVVVHATPKKIDYRLEDRDGLPAVPVLNQASINAVSLALLFAQAEERARVDGLSLVLLDDPAQSLDAERQAGLARAIERLSAACSVLVTTTPAPLADRVRDFVSTPRRLLHLAPRDVHAGARVERTEDR